jgi:formylglycine-generating enzyme required for sulfatase activity
MTQHAKNAMPKVVEDCHELLAWIIPKLDQYPRNRVGRVSDSVTRRIGAAHVGLRYLATLNKLTRPTCLFIFVLCSWLAGSVAYADSVPPQAAPTQTTVAKPKSAPAVSQHEGCQLADSQAGPAMVAIRPAYFQMGSPNNEAGRADDEGPQHGVTIPRPFALSRCEITVGQFKQFINESGYQTTAETNGTGCYVWNSDKSVWLPQAGNHWKNPGFAQTDAHPVVCVSWQDTQRYVQWLAQRSGALYRLPTEAEWEYAARADTPTARYFGTESQCEYVNGLGQEAKSIAVKDWILAQCSDNYVYTAPVSSFKPNAFGLYDMLGNAYEWTQDCWHDNYADAPPDSSAWLDANGGQCVRRVVRGGSWGDDPLLLRSAYRSRNINVALNYAGFRVARAL